MSVAQAQLSERVRRGASLANGLSLVLVGGKVKVYTHPPVACAVLRAAIGLPADLRVSALHALAAHYIAIQGRT
jgi:hypothetical protein